MVKLNHHYKAVMKKVIGKAERPAKVVNIPLLFKNCEIEVSTPHRNILGPKSTRGSSAKSLSRPSEPKSTSNRKEFLSKGDGKKVIKIDLKKNSEKTVIKAMVKAAGCKSQSHIKTKASLPVPVVPAKENQSTIINTDRTSITTLTQRSLPERLSNRSSLKPQQLIKSRNGSTRQFHQPDQVSTQQSDTTTLPCPASQLQDLRQRFIKKRSEVYQVLCNLDSKFDKMKKKDNILGEIQANSKQHIVDLVREKTSPKNPALFNKTLAKPNFITVVNRKDSLTSQNPKKL